MIVVASNMDADVKAALAAKDDGHGMVEDAMRAARARTLARENEPQIVTAEAGTFRDEGGLLATHNTPRWIYELTLNDLRTMTHLPVGAWVEDETWPLGPFRPAFDNLHSWSMIVDHAACLCCTAIFEEGQPSSCPECGFSRDDQLEMLAYMEAALKGSASGFLRDTDQNRPNTGSMT